VQKKPFSLSDIEKMLPEIVSAVDIKKGIVRKLEQARNTLRSERERLIDLETIMNREKRDVDRLEGLSLYNLFHTVLGDKPDIADKEQQEFLSAKLRHDQAKASVKALEDDVEALASDLAGAGRPEDDLRELLEAKEQFLLASGSPEAEALLSIDEKIGRLSAERKEVSEALDAGRRAASALEEVLRSLQSAQGWGVWDMMGGGLLATAAKHSNLDKAQEQVNRAQSHIHRFQRELKDVGRATNGLAIEGFERFADYFFDGLFIDWMVQSKINTSVDRTRGQLSKIESLVRSLSDRSKSLESRIRSLKAERENLLARISV